MPSALCGTSPFAFSRERTLRLLLTFLLFTATYAHGAQEGHVLRVRSRIAPRVLSHLQHAGWHTHAHTHIHTARPLHHHLLADPDAKSAAHPISPAIHPTEIVSRGTTFASHGGMAERPEEMRLLFRPSEKSRARPSEASPEREKESSCPSACPFPPPPRPRRNAFPWPSIGFPPSLRQGTTGHPVRE